MLYLLACVGLSGVPEKPDGHNLDSGRDPGDSGDVIDSAEDGNRAPTADAGDDQEVLLGDPAVLDGGNSDDPDGDPLDYVWEIVSRPGGSSAALSDETDPSPTFIADREGSYTFQLVVSDGALESEPDEVNLRVSEGGGAPTADAGANQSVTTGDTVYLDGSSSHDPDGDPISYTWTMVSKPSGSSTVLTAGSSATPRFLADVDGQFVLSLVVSDGTHTSAEDEVTVTASTDSGGGTSGCGCHSSSVGDLLPGMLAGMVFVAKRWMRRRG